MSLRKIIWILAAALVLLVAGIAVLVIVTLERGEDEIPVASFDPSGLVAVEFNQDETASSLWLENGKWNINKNSRIPFSEEAFVQYILAVSDVTAQKQLSYNAENLKEYGLDDPSKNTTFLFKDGSTLVFRAGEITPDQQGVYIEQGERIFIVELLMGMYLSGSAKNFVNPELTQRPGEDLLSIELFTMETEDKTCRFALKSAQEQAKSSSVCVYRMNVPFDLDIDPDWMTDYFDLFYTLSADSVFALTRTGQPYISQDRLFGKIDYTFKGAAHTLCFYPLDGGEGYAVTVDDFDLVFSVSEEKAKSLFVPPEAMVTRFIYTNNLNALSEISVTAEGKETKIGLTWKSEEDLSAVCNGQSVSDKDVRRLYVLFLKARINALSDESYGSLFLTVKLTEKSGTADTLRFYDSGREQVAVTVNGKPGVFTDRQSVSVFMDNVKRLAAGEPVEEVIG